MRTMRSRAVGAVVILGGLVLGACSAPDEAVASPPGSGSTSSAPPAIHSAPTDAATDDPEPLAAGVVVGADRREEVEAAGMRVIWLSQTEGVVVDPAQPLPDAARAQVAESAAAAVAGTDGLSRVSAAVDAASRAGSRTGRQIALVIGDIGDHEQWGAAASLGIQDPRSQELGHASLTGTADEAVRAAEAWIASQPDAAMWDIVLISE